MVRDAAAYLFGLIRKALAGTFRLWPCARTCRNSLRQKPRKRHGIRPSRHRHPCRLSSEAAYQSASREVALVYFQRMKTMLQGTAKCDTGSYSETVPGKASPNADRPRCGSDRVLGRSAAPIGGFSDAVHGSRSMTTSRIDRQRPVATFGCGSVAIPGRRPWPVLSLPAAVTVQRIAATIEDGAISYCLRCT